MRILCVFGRHAYGDPGRGESYEHANFLPALQKLGHEAELFDSWDRSAYRDFAHLNRALVERIEIYRPDVVFCVLMHYEIWIETLDLVRERGNAAVLNWGTDDSWKFEQFGRFLARHVDLYATTSLAARATAVSQGLDNVVLSQWAASASTLAEPLFARECRHAVSFVGAAYGNRRRWIGELAARGIEVDCYGYGWPKGPIATSEVARIARESAVSLSFGDSGLHFRGLRPYRSRQIKARTFEVPGAGGLLLCERADGLERYYVPDREISLFDSADEAASKIRGFLTDAGLRDRVARSGHERTAREHTYEQRLAPLLEQATTIAGARSRGAGNRSVDREVLDRLAAAHSAGPGLRALRAGLAAFLSLVFGRRRGPRAARRLLFELSWRIVGEGTYSCRGWPGRLFYRES